MCDLGDMYRKYEVESQGKTGVRFVAMGLTIRRVLVRAIWVVLMGLYFGVGSG